METPNLLLLYILILSFSCKAQPPISWTYAAKKTSTTEATLMMTATMGDRWHLYSQVLPEGGPLKTTFAFSPSKSFELIGSVVEPEPIIQYDKFFGLHVGYFEKAVVFQQKIKLTDEQAIVNGTVQFMLCSDVQCLPPQTEAFSIEVD